MNKILSYLLSPVFHIYYALLLLVFHPVQVFAHWLFGDFARKKVVDVLNLLLIIGHYILGCRITFNGFDKIPENRPLIIVSNHQSMFDIPPIVWGFRKYYPRFISKIELSKWYPSISYNLKYGKSALIDRKNRSQAVKEISKLGKLIEANNHAVSIFPEGTRSKTGKVKEFKVAGISTLLHAAPSAVIVPFVINGHSRFFQKGLFQLNFGQRITYTVLEPVIPKDKPIEEIVKNIEMLIKKSIGQ